MRTGICNFVYGGKRTKSALDGWHTCTAGGCRKTENLTAPEPLGSGTGAIRQESFMLSHLSAPQAQCVRHFAWPVLRNFGTLRFSRIFSDARRPRLPPGPGWFLVVYPENYLIQLFRTIPVFEHLWVFLPVIVLFNTKFPELEKNRKRDGIRRFRCLQSLRLRR